jgi:hypothetical protein
MYGQSSSTCNGRSSFVSVMKVWKVLSLLRNAWLDMDDAGWVEGEMISFRTKSSNLAEVDELWENH